MNAVGVLGGVPAYLRLFRQDRDFETNLVETVLDPGSPLFEEPRFLMMEEVREPQSYFSACRAMRSPILRACREMPCLRCSPRCKA